MIECGFSILIILYCLSIVYLWLGWERIPIYLHKNAKPSVAVLIPVRNEASNILALLKSLEHQSYNGNLEFLIINDHSQDESKKVAEKFISDHSNFKLISLGTKEGKKVAITAGVKNTQAEIMLTIDGDCKAPTTWVEAMVNAFEEKIQFVSGPVVFSEDDGLFSKMQSIEFASLIGSGAALIGWHKPLVANGANMGFRRKAFLEVNGFEGNAQTASGDDVFLLHKIAKQYPNGVTFVKQEGSIVKTKAQPNLTSFVRQRIRWASKWKAYQDLFAKASAVLVFLLTLSIICYPIIVGFNSSSLFLWVNLLVMKSIFDFFFIRQVSRFLGNRINLLAFIILQILYPFYVVLIGLFSFQKSYDWKGRRVQ